MTTFQLRAWALFAAILGLGLSQATEARASTFEVNPIRMTLSASSTSGLLTVRNISNEALRFQVNAYAWSQKQTGEIQLAATQDIVFFPAMLALKPGESRNIRVGTAAPFDATEKTYRVFVEEMPPIEGNTSNAIRVLTRFGVPVFLAPSSRPTATPRLDGLALLGRTLSFALKNDGNTHFLTQRVRILAEGPSGNPLLEQELPAWYVLAGGLRSYTFDLPASACGATRLVVSVDSDAKAVQSTLPVPASTCTR
jgi:fimbrial chaperone protein